MRNRMLDALIALSVFVAVILAVVALGINAAHAAVSTADSAPSNVRVARHNTLSGLAAIYCGAASRWPALYAANRAAIADPDLIYPGQVLRIACRGLSAASRGAARPTPVRASGWVNPIRAGLRASGPGACWGAARVGHRHKGVDLSASSDTPIHAVATGWIERMAYDDGGAGWYVVLDHGHGVWTVYEHMRARSFLRVGAYVARGETIGYVGATGNAHGPHLHFEVHISALWHPVNPAIVLRAHGVNVGC